MLCCVLCSPMNNETMSVSWHVGCHVIFCHVLVHSLHILHIYFLSIRLGLGFEEMVNGQ